jgi:Zn-dependent protease with chaperone function
MRRTLATFLVVLATTLGLAAPAGAQGDPGGATTAQSAAGDTITTETAQARDYLAEVRADFSDEDRAYRNIRTPLTVLEPFFAIAVGLLILFTGLAARMRDIAQRVTRFRYVHVFVFVVLYTLVVFVISFPLAYYSGFALEHQFDLSTESFGAWLADEVKGVGVGIFFFGVVPLVWLAYAAIRKSRRWWLWLAFGSIPVSIIGVLIQPLVIDPLFNKFEPMRDQALKQQVLALAEKADIPGRNVFQVDKSTETKTLNAYVSGFGASQRIVFWDTILDAMSDDELLFVTGHEMGHYVLGHIWKWMAFLSVLGFALFFFAGKLMEWSVARFGGRWGFTELHDIASLPLLVLAFGAVSLVAQPLVNAWSRTLEHEADVFALEVTHDNDAGARAFLVLGSQNRSNPDPSQLEVLWLRTHPPLAERVKFMLEYRPWEEGKPNKVWKG